LITSDLTEQAIEWRRHLHAHPELSFEEHETAAFVEERLRAIGGLEIERPTPTSVVAHLDCGPGRTLALRADMDALPIDEQSGVEFSSTRPGVMHACGHDTHTATLLAVAQTLVERRSELAGEVRFIFQHAEELPPGGAVQLVAAGVMDGVDCVIGQHIFADAETGKVIVRDGRFMASPDSFSVTVRGRGGHGAYPHHSVDPVAAAAQIIVSLQQIVAREVDPVRNAVVTVAHIHAGSADNVIPEEVTFGGTVRTFEPEVKAQIRDAIERIATGVAGAHRCTAALTYEDGYDSVINNAEVAELVRRNVDPERLIEYEPVMGGEDFSAYMKVVPGCFFAVGGGGEYPHHHPRFQVDEEGMRVAAEIFVNTTLDFLKPEA
jgi:amidohydrolase